MMLSLEFHHSCRYDYVEVRDGDSINSGVIGRFCGNNRPAPIQSSGNSLHVLFVSDGYKNFDGFFATFQENSGKSKCQLNRQTFPLLQIMITLPVSIFGAIIPAPP